MAQVMTKMRKFLNDTADVVKESLAGLAAAHSDLVRYDPEAQILVSRFAPKQGKVALISGGGSGHEPMHGGFVGYGMLDAACPGEVFTSPVPDQMLAATKAVDGGGGQRLRRRRAGQPPRQELHRRRAQLQNGGGRGSRRRHQGRVGPDRRR